MRECPQCGRTSFEDVLGSRPGQEERVVCNMCAKCGYWAPLNRDPRITRRIRRPSQQVATPSPRGMK